MSEFLDRMKATAKADKKTIVLPEGEDPRTIEAARAIVDEGIADLVILGDPERGLAIPPKEQFEGWISKVFDGGKR